MSFINRALISFFLLTNHLQALAVDLDYYSYGGFDVTVNAFRRVSLIFNDAEYIVMFFIAALFGILFGGIISAGKKLLGGGGDANVINFLVLVLVGVGVFKALIIPKGNVHIYDPVVNRYEMVGGVPDLIVVAAGITNKGERVLTEIMDSSSSHARSLQGNGIGLELLLNAFNGNVLSHEAYVQKSVHQYISDCLPPAEALPTYTFNLKDIKSETSNIMNELSKLKSASVYTTTYSESNKPGTSMSCSDAWDSVLAPALNDGSLFDEYVEQTCAKSSFAVSDPSLKAAQLARCKVIIEDAQDLMFDPSITGDYNLFMRNIMLSKTLVSALSESPGTGIRVTANKDLVTSGLASQMISEDWLPAIKAVVFGVVLGLMPIIALFMVTPLIFKSLHIMVGLLLWVALWGVADAMVHGIAMDQILTMSHGSISKGMSLEALLLLPEQATKGLAILGKAQSMGVILSTFIAGIFFRISGYAFSQLSEKWQQDIDRFGDRAGQEALDPASNIETIKRNMDAQSLMSTMGYMGMNSFSLANQSMVAAPFSQSSAQLKGLSNGGMSTTSAVMGSGDFSGGERAGEILKQDSYAEGNFKGDRITAGVSHAMKKSEIEIEGVDGRYDGFKEVSQHLNKGVPEVIADGTRIEQIKDSLGNENYKKDVLNNNPDNSFASAVDLDRSAVSTTETSANRITNERLSQMAKSSGGDRIYAAQMDQLIKTTDDFAKHSVTGGDSTPYLRQSMYSHTRGLSNTNAVINKANENGVSVGELGRMQGEQEVLGTIGDYKGIKTSGEQSFIDGRMVHTAREAMQGEVELSNANLRDVPLEQQLLGKLITAESSEYAETKARLTQESATGLSTDDLMMARAQAKDSEMTLSQLQAEQVISNLGLEGTATDEAISRGGLADLKLDNNGNLVSSRGYSGSSGSKDNLLSVESGLRLDQGVTQMAPGSLAYTIANREFETRDEYNRLFSGIYGDDSVRESVFIQRAQELNDTLHSSVTYLDILGHREAIEASIGTPDLFETFTPVGIHASATGYNEGQITDQDTYNAHKLVLGAMYDQAIKEADEYRDSYIESVPNAPIETYSDVHERFAAEKFAEYERAYTESVSELGHEKLKSFSDQYNDNTEKNHVDVKVPVMKNLN